MLSRDSRDLLEQRLAEGRLAYEHYRVDEARALIAAAQTPARHPLLEGRTGRCWRTAVTCHAALTVFEPESDSIVPRPVVIYMHGGGWVFGELEAHRLLCARLAARSGWVVASVDYRLAPEHPFPAAYEDCIAALGWLRANAGSLALDSQRVVLAGDSAGGTLAAAVAEHAAEAGIGLSGRILIYPSLDQCTVYPSDSIDVPGMAVTGRTMAWFRSLYFPAAADRAGARASPLTPGPDAAAAPTLIISAGYDPLRDEAVEHAARCQARRAGACTHEHYPGELHGFLTVGPDFAASGHALAAMTGFLSRITD
ncbi:alpha/beta hydrolase [Salinisphaera sp. T31B1]|uniref:alpha/beta hydrolase n=1 Tax=Salinisphaera sp. T31B1 TaxID=727963 RepID=UPI003342761B